MWLGTACMESPEFSTALDIYAHVLAEHMEQFERQRARILGTYRAPDVGGVAEEQQVAWYP